MDDVKSNLSFLSVVEAEQPLHPVSGRKQDALSAFDRLADGFVAMDRDLRYILVNDEAERICQRRREEMIGRTYWELFPYLLGTITDIEFRGAMSERVPRRFEVFFDVSSRWFEINASPYEDGLAVYFRDVTERKQNEIILDGQKQALELAVHGSPLMSILEVLVRTAEASSCRGVVGSILVVDADGKCLRHGAAPSLPDDYSRAIDGLVIGPLSGCCGRAAYTRQPVIVEDIATSPLWAPLRELAARYQLRACWSTPILSPEGRAIGTFGLYYREEFNPQPRDLEMVQLLSHTAALAIERDRQAKERLRTDQALAAAKDDLALQVRELKRAERALRDNEERFRHALVAANMGSWRADLTAGVSTSDANFCRILGRETTETTEAIEDRFRQIHPDDRERVLAAWRGAIENQGPYEAEFRLTCRDGAMRWLREQGRFVAAHNDQPDLLTGVTLDVTERKGFDEALQQSKEAAEQANRSKDEFLAMLGHELRNPLAPILTALQLMQLRGDDYAQSERAVIARQVKHVVRLVDDLLDVSRITRGKTELKKSIIELNDITSRAIEMASPLLEQRAHHLSVSVERNLWVCGDLTRLAQVVSNLLTNAAKYTETGGQIFLSASRSEEGIQISVRDSGIGIPAATLPRIFELFVQAEPAIDRAQGGLGLGLTIVRSLVELHGGQVTAHSDGPGRGSEFIITLPATSELPSVQRRGGRREALTFAAERGQRILLVDDNEDAAELMAEALRTLGHEVWIEWDGPSAFNAISKFEPQVALLDIGLPVMDGYELARRLRERFSRSALYLIAITGYGQESDRERARDVGFDAHLVKPVDLAVLNDLLSARSSGLPTV